MPPKLRNRPMSRAEKIARTKRQKRQLTAGSRKPTRSGGEYGSLKSVMAPTLMKETIAYHADALPRILVTKFTYSDVQTLSTNALQTVSAGGSIPYRINTPYDPYYLAGGSSAQGWGIATSYYGNYIVTGAKINVTFSDPSADGMWCGIRFRQALNNDPIGESLLTLKNTQQTFCKAINNSGDQVQSFDFFVRPWVLGSKDRKSYMYEDDNAAATNAIPANDLYVFDAFVMNQNASAQTIQCIVTIKYIVKLYNRVAI